MNIIENNIARARMDNIKARQAAAKKFVYVSIIKEGYHCFPEAANDPRYATGDEYDVSHLANKHMHYFYIKVWVEVNHLNRDIEFIQLRRWLESLYSGNTLQLNNKSCEMIAEDLFEVIANRYPNLEVRIDVSEDNINGALIEFKSLTTAIKEKIKWQILLRL